MSDEEREEQESEEEEEEEVAFFWIFKRFGMRVQRLLGHYSMNAPEFIIRDEMKLVEKGRAEVLKEKEKLLEIFDATKAEVKKGLTRETVLEKVDLFALRTVDYLDAYQHAHRLFKMIHENPEEDEDETHGDGILFSVEWFSGVTDGLGFLNEKDKTVVGEWWDFIVCEWLHDEDGFPAGADPVVRIATRMPKTADWETLRKGLERIWEEVREPLRTGKDIQEICERLSWIEPSWFK